MTDPNEPMLAPSQFRKPAKSIKPPLRVAWHQALASIRVRFLRHAVTSVGIALGIAFFASIQALRIAEAGQAAQDPTESARLLWLVWTSLIMCLVGVTNSMLMSVTERYREIGTIKCLGGSDGFIVKVFFLEALLLGLIGSLIGSLAGVGLMAVVVWFAGNPLTLAQGLSVVGFGVLLGVILTVLAAIAPAIQAARMPAASALRVEV
jgi:putative ABC transport system permease protein